jgi:hypothetical protein
MNAPFPALLPFLYASWKSCSVKMFSTACDSVSITSTVLKWRPFSFIFFNRGNSEKLGGWRTTVRLYLVKNVVLKEEVWDVSWLVAKIRDEIFAHFYAVAVKRHSSKRNWLFGLPGWILCEQSPWCQLKLWASSWFCYLPVSPFSFTVNLDLSCTVHAFFPESLSNHCQGLRRTFSEIFTQFGTVLLSYPSRNRIRPDTRLQTEGSKKSALSPSCVKCCTLIPNIC